MFFNTESLNERAPHFNCFIVPIQFIYARLFTLVEFFVTM